MQGAQEWCSIGASMQGLTSMSHSPMAQQQRLPSARSSLLGPVPAPRTRCFSVFSAQPARPQHSARSAAARKGRSTYGVVVAASSEAVVHETQASSSKQVPQAPVWEIDFCSRPLLDERGKKVWELLICDADRTFEYSEYFPNSKINSGEVRLLNT